jgi:hypothetical protein
VGKIFREILGRESTESEYQTFVRWLTCYQQDRCQEEFYGAILLKSGYAEWMDIRVADLNLNGTRFQGVYDWARDHGYVGGILNFNEAIYPGRGQVYGALLVHHHAADWKNIPVAELGFPGIAEDRFKAVHDWARKHEPSRAPDYVGGFSNFHEDITTQGPVYGAVLLRPDAADWKEIPVAELGPPPKPGDPLSHFAWRFIAVYGWAVAHGYVGGFPNFQHAFYPISTNCDLNCLRDYLVHTYNDVNIDGVNDEVTQRLE